MLKQRKPLNIKAEKTAKIPAVRVLIAIAVIYALIKTIQIHPFLGIVYAILAVVVFFHFRRRRQLEAAGVEMPSPYAAERFKPDYNSEAATAEKNEAIEAENVEIVEVDSEANNEDSASVETEEKKKSLPKRLDKSECRH